MRMFKTLVKAGFKGNRGGVPPPHRQTDFDFVRKLIEEKHIPDDVTIEVRPGTRSVDPAHLRGTEGRAPRHRAYL